MRNIQGEIPRNRTLSELLKNREQRQMLLWAEARRLGELFHGRGAESVWVFGSLARGTATIMSDLDLWVVWPTDLPPLQRAISLLADSHPKVSVDLLVYTPEEFARIKPARQLEGAVKII